MLIPCQSRSTLTSLLRCVLSMKEKEKPTTVQDYGEIIELHKTLSKDLLELREAQRIHTPGLVPLLEGNENPDEPIKQWLPSEPRISALTGSVSTLSSPTPFPPERPFPANCGAHPPQSLYSFCTTSHHVLFVTTMPISCIAASSRGQNGILVFRPVDTSRLSKRGKVYDQRRLVRVRPLPWALGTCKYFVEFLFLGGAYGLGHFNSFVRWQGGC